MHPLTSPKPAPMVSIVVFVFVFAFVFVFTFVFVFVFVFVFAGTSGPPASVYPARKAAQLDQSDGCEGFEYFAIQVHTMRLCLCLCLRSDQMSQRQYFFAQVASTLVGIA